MFDRRLAALASSHTSARQTDLRTLIENMLAPYGEGRGITLSGPRVAIAPETSTTLDLALHELATNAAKYGSLSWPSGRLDVAGDVVQADAAEGQFELSWMESGGPPVAPPTRSGFGRAVIERNLAQSLDATVSLEFNSDGLRCTLTAPFNEKFGKL